MSVSLCALYVSNNFVTTNEGIIWIKSIHNEKVPVAIEHRQNKWY